MYTAVCVHWTPIVVFYLQFAVHLYQILLYSVWCFSGWVLNASYIETFVIFPIGQYSLPSDLIWAALRSLFHVVGERYTNIVHDSKISIDWENLYLLWKDYIQNWQHLVLLRTITKSEPCHHCMIYSTVDGPKCCKQCSKISVNFCDLLHYDWLSAKHLWCPHSWQSHDSVLCWVFYHECQDCAWFYIKCLKSKTSEHVGIMSLLITIS